MSARARWRAGRGAGLLLAGVLPFLLAGCGAAPTGHPAASGSAHASGRADGPVPWRALDPTYPSIPSRTIQARPDPAAAEGATPCRASRLRASSELGGAGGSSYLSVRLSSERPCRLEGTPTVTLLDGDRPVDVPVRALAHDAADDYWVYRHPVLVAPGSPATVTLIWGTDWCTDPVATDRVRLALGGGRGAVTVRGFKGSPGCTERVEDLPPTKRHRTPVEVGTFKPLRYRPARVVTPYDGLDARAQVTSTPRPGRPFSFVVTLTARRDVVLDPCPDYTIGQYLADQDSREDRYALNCAAVPTRDARGRPYLPAGQPVRFEMRTRLLADSPGLKFVWALEVPHQPGAGIPFSGAR